jgi:hypothetical protein
MIFGPSPKAETVPRYIENKEKDSIIFYRNKNIYFLPDWFSEFLQVKLHVCLDITVWKQFEVLFVGLMVYSQIVILRIALSWYIYINTFPWCCAAVDWTECVTKSSDLG